MSATQTRIPTLQAGDNLSRADFLRRWEAMPDLKRAELIGGVVYMPSPLTLEHADRNSQVNHWLSHYALHTPGCRAGSNATWLMLDESPQPDNHLRILPEFGGKSTIENDYASGAPEFVAEVCLTSAAFDLHQKLQLYQQAGVDEYLAVLLHEREIHWHWWDNGTYQIMPPDTDGVHRSHVYPGLWLNGAALLDGNMEQVLKTLQNGLESEEHAEFVLQLRQRYVGG